MTQEQTQDQGQEIAPNQIGNLPPEKKLESQVETNGFASKFAQQVQAQSRNTAARKGSDRDTRTEPRERSTTFGGPRLKLSVIGRIDGYHLYWANDQEGEIETLLYEGFEFVEPHEVRMQSHIVADADLAERVSRYVGAKADGSPLRAYLMKCTDEHWRDREDERYRQANAWEESIMKGRDAPGTYKPKSVQTEIDTKFKKEY